MAEWFSSRRDSTIVARYEVPGERCRGNPVPEGRLKSLSVPNVSHCLYDETEIEHRMTGQTASSLTSAKASATSRPFQRANPSGGTYAN
jgi:hypothetical protein